MQLASDNDIARVTELIGRKPKAPFRVVVRSSTGDPVVIENAPFCFDGEPMPTRYWLVGNQEIAAVGRIESAGGVRQAEEEIDPEAIALAHKTYAQERDALVPDDEDQPKPFGGVGGTRKGVKCLHAHYAWYLAGGNDPVGDWTAARIDYTDTYKVESL